MAKEYINIPETYGKVADIAGIYQSNITIQDLLEEADTKLEKLRDRAKKIKFDSEVDQFVKQLLQITHKEDREREE